jgi:hypothetical protein
VFSWSGGRLDRFDGADAAQAWCRYRTALVTDPSTSRGGTVWTAGVWLSGDGEQLVLLTEHC